MEVLCINRCFIGAQLFESGRTYDYSGPANRHLRPTKAADLANWNPPVPKPRDARNEIVDQLKSANAMLARENAEVRAQLAMLERRIAEIAAQLSQTAAAPAAPAPVQRPRIKARRA